MPSTLSHLADPPRKGRTIKSALDSESFDADGTIHVDGLVGSATISPSGRDIALASPEGLAIIDLDSPYSPPRRLSSHGLPWLVVDVQWSPFAARDYWVASTANHRCLVWNLNLRDDSSSGAIEHSLQGHSRAITDINFSAHHPDLLATCSVDGYVHSWDLRRPRQPALTFCDWFAGATQVKYNRQDGHILASSHDRWLHIWDDRKAAKPLKTISAHTSKIYGLDWNRTSATGVVTCSLDRSIKFWDYGRDCDDAERVIRTGFPVWRARHTPFGWGLLAMPQNEPGNLYLYDQRDVPQDGAAEPVTVFPGHGNHKVKEFLWRFRGGLTDDGIDNRDFQLVSWGEDNELRLQRMDPNLLESVGYVKGSTARKNLNITRKGATYKTFRTVDDSVHRDRRSATMSDPRPGSGGSSYRRGGISLALRSGNYKTGPSWRGASMRAKLSSKELDRSQAQIGWMRGITMTKRKSSSDTPKRGLSKDSLVISPGFHEDEWGEPETIHEEFIRISNQLPNVKWENIDMDSLSLKASLRGPWGVGGDTIFIKVQVNIPTTYPKLKAPKFFIEKSSFMPDQTHHRIEQEVYQIGNQFLKRRQNCLDVAFSYLLGEVDLATSTSFLKNVKDLDDDLDGLADESSSEDDDNGIPAGGSAAMSQELSASTELDAGTSLATSQRPPAIPPLPRYCGARFSNDGRLVCFFPTKDEKAKSFLFTLTDSYREKAKGEPNFAGFGRIAQDSPPPKQRYTAHDETSATEDHSEGSEESGGSSSSSDSELTTLHKVNVWYQPMRRFRKTWSANDSLRSSGGGTGGGTGTGTGASRRRPGKPRNIISIYDLRSELPSKKQFAQEYAIFGDGAEVCEHNARVAQKYGYPDLVDIWKYSALLLKSDIPLELHELYHRKESVLVIAKEAVYRAHDDESPNSPEETSLSGRVKWGCHPLAQEFIRDLFEYFEKLADIQMLAMLSCIFGESSAEDGVAYAESHLTQPETPLPMKAPSFSLEYFPADPSLWNVHAKSQASSAITTPRTAHTPVLYADSPASDEAAWVGEPGSNSYSTGETPPAKSGREHLVEIDQTQSLSTSPDSRSIRRSNSTAANFAASLPRALAGVVSASPPNPPPARKRPSPAEAILGGLAPSSITWGGSTVFGAPVEGAGTARTSVSDDDHRRDDITVMIPVAVSCLSENQGLFDDDGWMSTPLLEASHSRIYASYRYAYAEMLQMWGQPLARLEIMKFDVLKDDTLSSEEGFGSGTADSSYPESYHTASDTNGQSLSNKNTKISNNDKSNKNSSTGHGATGTISPVLPFGGRKEQLQALLASGRGLDVTGICHIHETQLDPLEYTQATTVGGAVGTCRRCRQQRQAQNHHHPTRAGPPPQAQLRCVYCAEPVDALYPACLSCGCASHEGCLAEWHAAGETECPAGDECHCAEDASRGQVESWRALTASLAVRDQVDRFREKEKERSGIIGRLRGIEAAAARRPRRRSVPAKLVGGYASAGLATAEGDGEGWPEKPRSGGGGFGPAPGSSRASLRGNDDEDEIDRDDWESVASSQGIPSAATGKPPISGDEPVSAARLSLGNRLKKSVVGDLGRPSAMRRKSGGVSGWRKTGG